MKFRFIGKGANSPQKILFMGTEAFTLGEVTDVQDSVCIEKLKHNPCFQLATDDAPVAVVESVETVVEEKPKAGKRKMAGQMFDISEAGTAETKDTE